MTADSVGHACMLLHRRMQEGYALCVSNEKGFTSLVRGGVEGELGRYNVAPHP